MATNMNELRVPVSLQISNLQSIINEIQGKLSNLKVGSKGFKEMDSLLGSLRREMDRLQIQTSKPFMSQNQFNAAERSVSKLEDGLERIQITMGRIKFTDLELDSSQLAQFKAYEDEIKNIKEAIKNVKETAKQEFLGGAGGAAWLGFSDKNAVAMNQSLAQITAAINSAFQQQVAAIDKAEAKLKEYQDQMALAGKLEGLQKGLGKTKTVEDLSKVLGDEYDKIFNSSGTAFKSGGKGILAQWLTQQFQLDESQVREYVQQSASKVLDSLKNGDLARAIEDKLSSVQGNASKMNGGSLQADVDAKKAKLEELRPALDSITAANNGLGTAADALNSKLSRTSNEFEQWKENVTAAAKANNSLSQACQKGNTQLEQFKSQLAATNAQFLQLERAQRNFNSIKMAITNFMGFTQVLNLTKRAVSDALNHIKELDSVMNKISIVTNVNTGDLWGQVDAYSDMAQKYGVSIKGAYEVSQIYYQQGLQTKDVLTLTNETLKLAKISGLDYASTTDYMTTALRGFKMEMSEASTVVDVYSNLAAHTAVTQEELAVAMSKTASSMESVGSTFQESSAMIATMVAVTRESATNIGSALKSIAARYGEMKNDPSKLIDSEGEVLAYNKVDAALQSVGITLKTTDGQFRNFTDVIIELGEKWDQLDSTQQRYIATQFAGNRQQSRFLALVSNIDLLKSNLNYAEDSEDTGTLQALKALDSIESKTEQVRVAYQQMYTTIGAENVWKGLLDGTRNVINTMNGLPKLFGKIPIGAIAMAADIIKVIKDLGLKALGGISKIWAQILPDNVMQQKGQEAGQAFANAIKGAITESSAALKDAGREAAIKTAEGAKEAQSDATTPARQVTEKQKQEVAAPATAPAIQVVEQSQQLANAAANAEQLANNQERAAEAAERQAAANSVNASSTADQAAALAASGYPAAFQSEVGYLHLDWDNLTEQSEAALVKLIASVANASDQLRAAFSAAGDDAIAGFVAGLLRGCGASADAASSVGKTSVEAIRTAIQSHSPSKATEQIGNDFVQGYILGIAAQGDKAIASGKGVGQATLDGLNDSLNEKSFGKLKTGLVEGIDKALAEVQPATMSDADWRTRQMTLSQERAAINATTFQQFKSGQGEAVDIFNMFARQMEEGRSGVATYLAAKQSVYNRYNSPNARAQVNAVTYPALMEADPSQKNAMGAVRRAYDKEAEALRIATHNEADAHTFNGQAPRLTSSNADVRIAAHRVVRDQDRYAREGEFGDGAGQDSARIHRIFDNAYDIRAQEEAKLKAETDKAYEQAQAQQAAADKARVDATNNPLWDKDAQEQLKNNPQLTATEEEQKWRAELAQMDADVKLRLDTTEAKQEAEEFKTTTESQPIEEKLQTAPSNDLSIDEQIAKWQQLKDINEQLQEAQKNQDTSKIDELSQKQWATASVLGVEQGYKSFLPEEIDNQINKLRGESNITLETHADTTPIQEEVKETKEKLETEPVQMSMFDNTSTGGNPIDPVLARQQELLQFYGGNKNAMFAQMGNSDEELRAAAERGAQSPEQAEINFQALKGLQEQRIETYNQEIEALNRLKATRAELDSVNKKENPEEYATKWTAFQDARKAYQDISGEKLNSNLGQQKIQEQIDSITARRDLIIEPQVKINPEEVTKPIEEAPPAKVQVEPQQVKMDLDHPGQENFVYVTPKVDESKLPQVQQEVQQAMEQVKGQVSLDDAIQGRIDGIKQQIEQLKQALEELNNYTFDSKTGNFVNGDKSMTEADYTALRGKYTSQIGALSSEQQGLQNMLNPAAAVEAQPVDMSATQEQIQGCIDKLIEMGTMSQEAGNALKDSLQGASPEELKAKLEELKAKVQEVGETSTSAGSKMKAAFSKNAGSIGAAMSMIASLFDKTSRGGQQAAGSIMAIGGAIRIVDALSKAAAGSNPWLALAMGIMAVVNGISMFIEDDSEKLERLNQQAEKTANASKEAKSEYKDLKSSVDKIEELKEKRYESAEAAEEYQNAVESLTDKFPGLIAGFDSAGNAILDVKSAEEQLTAARSKAARAAIEAANDAKQARAQEMKTKAKEMSNANMADFTASWQIGQWDNTGAVTTSTYTQSETEFGKTTQALAEMGGWNKDSSVMQYMMTGGATGKFSPLWDAENNQYVVPESEVLKYAFWGAGALEDSNSLDIIKQHAYGTPFDPDEWSGLQGEMSTFYGQGIEAIHAIPGEMSQLSDSTKTYLSSMTQETMAYNKSVVDQYGTAPVGARLSRIEAVLPFVDGQLTQKVGTDYLHQFTGFGNAAFVEAKSLHHEDYNWQTDPAYQAYLNGKSGYQVDGTQTNLADWREVTIDAVRQKQGDDAANNLYRFLLGNDSNGKAYFNNSEWEGTGNTESTGAVGQLLKLVQKSASEGNTYNAEFFFDALQPFVEFLGSDWMTSHGFGDAWGEVTQMMEYIRDAKKLNRSDDLTMLSESTNLLAAAHPDEHKYDFISQSSGLASTMYSQMLDSDAGASILRAIENDEDPALAMYTYGSDIITAYSNFYDQFAGRMSEDGEELTTVFERMLSDTENYSDADIIAWCNKYGIKVDGIVAEALKHRLDQNSEYYEGLLASNLKNNTTKYEGTKVFDKLNEFLTSGDYTLGEGGREYTKAETSYFSKVIAQASKMTDNGFGEVAQTYIENAIGLFTQLDGETAEIKKAILASVAKNGISTREGINKVIADAKAAGMEDTSWLEKMRDGLVTNLNLAIQTMTSELMEDWKDSGKTLKKLTSGIDFTEVQGMLDMAEGFTEIDGKKFTLSRSDFKANGDKLVLSEEKAIEYWQYYSATMYAQADEWTQTLNEAMTGLGALNAESFTEEWVKSLDFNNENVRKWLSTVSGGKTDALIVKGDNGTWSADPAKILTAVQEGHKIVSDGIADYRAYLDYAGAQVIKTTQWAKGNYSSLKTIFGFTEEDNTRLQTRLENLLSGTGEGEDSLEHWADEPDVKNAVKQIRSKISSFVSDVIAKGFDQIDLSDYEGLPDWIVSEWKNQDHSESMYDFAKKYVKYLGNDLEASNDMILTALEKDRKKTSKDVIKDLTFLNDSQFTATGNELKEFANTFGLDLVTLIENGIVYYDDILGEYVVNYTQIEGLDLSQVQGFQDVVQDSINDFFKKLGDLVKKGLTGSLTNADVTLLKEYLASIGYDFNKPGNQLDFTQTAEGLKLSEESAIQLYTTLKQIKPLEASLVFDDLWDSLEKAHEEFQSVTGLLGYIADTSAKISNADSKVSDNRLKQYQAELSVAQEILAVRATQEDSSFNFMSNKIPGAQNNPINYYENWASAFGKIRTALQTKASVTNRKTGKKELRQGLIDYEDWYNIVTEMGHIAEMVGGDGIKFGNKTLRSAEDAAALIEEGAKALTVDKSGNVKVALGSIAGLGIDMKTGAETMAENVDEGIRSVAKSQVKMLDGLIAMLEIIVAMEQLGDITGEDTTIDLGDIFAVNGQAVADENLDLVNGYTDKFKKAQSDLEEYLRDHADAKKLFENTKMRLGGQSYNMYDMLVKRYEDTWETMELSGENKKKAMTAFQGMLNSFYQAAISGNFDTADIAASVQKVMNETGLKLSDFVFNFTDEAGNITRTLTYVGNTLVNIDWQDDKTRQQFNKLFGRGGTVQEYQNYIQELIEEYWKNMEGGEEVTLDRQIEIRTRLGVASNEFVISKGKGLDGKTQYTGYYDGQKFTDKDQQKVLEQMAEAAMYKDQGFDFTLEKDSGTDNVTAVKGKTTVSGVEVEVNFNEKGQVRYSYNGQNNLTEEQLAAQLASEGRQEKGGTYHYTDTQGKEHTVTVQYDATMGISYSYDVIVGQENGIYKYNGHEFTSYDALYKFNEFRKAIDPNSAGHWTDNNQYVFTVTSKNGIKINSQYDATTGEISVKIGDRIITGINSKALAEYMKVAQMAEFEESTSEQAGTTEGATKREFKFNVGNAVINGEIDLEEGTTTYTYYADGNPIGTANSLEALQAILKMANLGDLENKTLTGQEVTWTIDGIKVKLKFNKDGKIEFAGTENGSTLSDEQQKTVDEAIAEMNKNAETLENDTEVQASKVIVKTAGAEVTMDPETLKIAEATGEITHLKATAKEVDADGNIKGVQVTGVADGEVHFKVGEVDKPTDDQLKAEGTVNWTNNYTAPEIEDLHRNVFWHHKGAGATGNILMDQATGNIGLAKAAGTLMGELGPELVVSNGRYFIAGQNGPEMVNLADDAIVFNHLQTKSLLEKGMSHGRGRAVTNERNAISFATGNVNLNNRPIIPPELMRAAGWDFDDDYATLFSSTMMSAPEAEMQVVMNVTPITEDGDVLTEGALYEYVEDYLLGDGTRNIDEILELDKNGLGLIIDIDEVKDNLNEAVQAYEETAVTIHDAQAKMYNQSAAEKLNQVLTDSEISSHVISNITDAIDQRKNKKSQQAKAKGTLMGELGPELVVSNGQYIVVGQNGPEMIDLDDDAIVFNHLQTRSLLKKGISSTRGKAVTNEQNAVSYAKGNINGGPAHAGASAALAALKQLRAQWKALESLTAQDLAGKGGGGGGGGGDPKAFIKELEKWYNWLQQIAKLEKDINLEEAKRSKIQSDMYAHGQDYYKSQKASLEAIKQTLVVQDSLAKSQEEYFNKRREELNKQSAFSSLYKFSESGQLYYQPGALEWLSDLSGRNATTGEANYTAKEQYEKLVAAGYGFAMKYDSSGNEIKQEGTDWYSTALQAFWDKIDADKEEMQSLHDSVEDAKNNVLQNQEAMNQILRDIEDNQIAVEQKVLKAVEESRQRAIDDAQEQRDALEEASNNVINGLSEQLQKEQEMYSQQQEVDELSKLQRQLAIMQRSGGSAAQIADLQQQIAEKQQDMYFDIQQKQIDTLQEASDAQIERLDHQIDIMTEQLEYEKENGLLWNQVYDVLQGSPEEIADFIQKNTSEYWGQSPTELAKNIREDLFEIQRFKEFQEDTSDIRSLLHQAFDIEDAKSEQKEKQTNYIKGLYQELFGREADEGGLAYWLEQMAAGMSEEDVRQGFMNSAEYKKLKGITDTSTTNTATASTNTSNNTTKTKGNNNIYYDPATKSLVVAGKNSKVTKNDNGTYTIVTKDKNGKEVERKDLKKQFGSGGLVTEPTEALIGETGKPEAVLNPEQTRILRENILSSRPDSLVSLLKSYREAYHGLSASTYDSISNNNNNSTIIERAEVNLQVAQLANDYDSKRAANTIMDEMLRIASKTSANNSVRR